MSQQLDTQKAKPQVDSSLLVSGLLQRSRTSALSAEHDQPTPNAINFETAPYRASNFNQDFSRIPVQSTTLPGIQTMPMAGPLEEQPEKEAEQVASKVANSTTDQDKEKEKLPPIRPRPVQSRLISSSEDEEKKKIAKEHARQAEEKKQQAEKEKATAEAKVIEAEQKKKEEGKVQPYAQPGQTPRMTPVLQNRLNVSEGGGQPLPEPTRGFMESRFKHDFSKVRVHNDPQATQSLKARAFTYRHNIFFNAAQYQPEMPAGQRLLAHELTHVVQQGAAQKKTVHEQ